MQIEFGEVSLVRFSLLQVSTLSHLVDILWAPKFQVSTSVDLLSDLTKARCELQIVVDVDREFICLGVGTKETVMVSDAVDSKMA